MAQQAEPVQEIFSDIGIDVRKINENAEKAHQQELEESLASMYQVDSAEPMSQPEMMEMAPQEPEFTEVMLSPEEIKERSGLLSYIRQAKMNFRENWEAMGISDDMVQNASVEELKIYIDDYKFRRDSISSFNAIYDMINRGIFVLEGMGGSFGFELGGLSQKLQQNEDYVQALKEVIHDNAAKLHLSPVKRLGLIVITTAYQVHVDNTSKKISKEEYQDF